MAALADAYLVEWSIRFVAAIFLIDRGSVAHALEAAASYEAALPGADIFRKLPCFRCVNSGVQGRV